MEIADLLTSERIFDAVRANDKPSLLGMLARDAAKDVRLNEADVAAALLGREKLGSTGVGQGIAIPHARMAGLARIHCALYKLSRPIEFGAVDDLPVDVVVVLLVPHSDERSGIQALSCIARRLKSPGLLAEIRDKKRTTPLGELVLGRR